MRPRPLIYSLAALLLGSVGLASAQDAYTSRPMNVRAGPNREYPLVAQLDAGAPLDVHGCLSDWSWCDVSFDDSRGWIYAGGVSFVYQGGRVPLYSYGPNLGLPVITFSLMTYWDSYYRGRPWYAQRDSWTHRTLPPHARPAGRPHAGPPPGRPAESRMGGRPEPQGEEHGRMQPQGAEHGGMEQSQGSERGRTPQAGRPHAGPPMMPNARPPAGGGQEARGAERGHSAPPAQGGRTQGGRTQEKPRESRPPDRPPNGNG